MEFQMKKVTGEPKYTLLEGKAQKHIFAAVCMMIGVSISVAVTPAPASEIAKDGDIAYYPSIYDVAQVKKIIDQEFKKHMPVNFTTDKKISIKTGKGTIEFIADVYQKDSGIAFEWTGAEDYDKDKKSSEVLSKEEMKLIKDYQFGSNYIVTLDTADEYELTEKVGQFIDFYMQQ